VSIGYNGTLPGEDNIMEMDNKTLPSVIHAEDNALRKLSRWERFWHHKHYTLFVTHTPCLNCAKMIVDAGVRRVYYLDNYGSHAGVEHLQKHQVEVMRLLAP
jgi:dCMP deaminase